MAISLSAFLVQQCKTQTRYLSLFHKFCQLACGCRIFEFVRWTEKYCLIQKNKQTLALSQSRWKEGMAKMSKLQHRQEETWPFITQTGGQQLENDFPTEYKQIEKCLIAQLFCALVWNNLLIFVPVVVYKSPENNRNVTRWFCVWRC